MHLNQEQPPRLWKLVIPLAAYSIALAINYTFTSVFAYSLPWVDVIPYLQENTFEGQLLEIMQCVYFLNRQRYVDESDCTIIVTPKFRWTPSHISLSFENGLFNFTSTQAVRLATKFTHQIQTSHPLGHFHFGSESTVARSFVHAYLQPLSTMVQANDLASVGGMLRVNRIANMGVVSSYICIMMSLVVFTWNSNLAAVHTANAGIYMMASVAAAAFAAMKVWVWTVVDAKFPSACSHMNVVFCLGQFAMVYALFHTYTQKYLHRMNKFRSDNQSECLDIKRQAMLVLPLASDFWPPTSMSFPGSNPPQLSRFHETMSA